MSEPSKDLVHARYMGDTPVVMKHLSDDAQRCCIDENQRGENEIEDGQLVRGHALVVKGDVILLDRYSAEGREDFVVTEPKSKSGKGKAAPKSEKE